MVGGRLVRRGRTEPCPASTFRRGLFPARSDARRLWRRPASSTRRPSTISSPALSPHRETIGANHFVDDHRRVVDVDVSMLAEIRRVDPRMVLAQIAIMVARRLLVARLGVEQEADLPEEIPRVLEEVVDGVVQLERNRVEEVPETVVLVRKTPGPQRVSVEYAVLLAMLAIAGIRSIRIRNSADWASPNSPMTPSADAEDSARRSAEDWIRKLR